MFMYIHKHQIVIPKIITYGLLEPDQLMQVRMYGPFVVSIRWAKAVSISRMVEETLHDQIYFQE